MAERTNFITEKCLVATCNHDEHMYDEHLFVYPTCSVLGGYIIIQCGLDKRVMTSEFLFRPTAFGPVH